MTIQTALAKTKTYLTKISPKMWLIGGGVLVVVLYGVVFFIPKTVHFSYAAETCSKQLFLAPDLQKVSSSDFDIELKDEIRLGSLTLATTGICVTPKNAPTSGTVTASIAPFGGVIARKQVNIEVPETPVARADDLAGREISTAQPLKIRLTSSDIIHRYTLKVADASTSCTQASAELSCDIPSLNLSHGTDYTAALYQTYNQDETKVAEGTLKTLEPLLLTAATIEEGKTLYDKPTSFTFTFDQVVTDTTIALVKVVGDQTEKIVTKTEAQGNTVTVTFDELARESSYRLTISQTIGENGSSLAAPMSYTFQTSGGPKVTAVSVGANSVSRNATILVTLDQPIDASIDLSKFARAEGVSATVRKQSDTQIAFVINGGDCAAFSLTIDKGLRSGSNGEESKDTWKFNSRTICGYSWSIGASVKGRSITAYSFGSGATTILFTGAIHGSEPSSYSTMLAWAQYLQAYGDIVPADKRVVIVPNTNPDGIAAGSRNNSRNVNLGRNFPTANWKASIETASGTLPTGGGTSAGSEPETAALMTLTRQLRPRLEVSFHAQGSLVGANKYADSVTIGNTYAQTTGYATMFYDAEAVMGYPMTGEYEDWMGEEMGIAAILIELPTTSGNYLTSQLPALKKLLAL